MQKVYIETSVVSYFAGEANRNIIIEQAKPIDKLKIFTKENILFFQIKRKIYFKLLFIIFIILNIIKIYIKRSHYFQ